MYRDDLAAMQAQVRTLRAELEAEKKMRQAAVAAAAAARASADEAKLASRRATHPPNSFFRQQWLAMILSGVMIPIILALTVRIFQEHQKAVAHRQLIFQKERTYLVPEQRLLELKRGFMQKGCKQDHHTSLETNTPTSFIPIRVSITGADDRPDRLSRAQIQNSMRGIKPMIKLCHDRFNIPGLALVVITVNNYGRVESAKVKGTFAGTPTGACITAYAMKATFPPFKGKPISVTYPFILR